MRQVLYHSSKRFPCFPVPTPIVSGAPSKQGAFYSNFSGKEDILLELKRRHMAAQAAELEVLLEQARQNPGRAMNIVEEWCLNLNQHIDWGKVSLELQLFTSRSSAFAKECDQLYCDHRRKLGEIFAGVFDLFCKTPPAPPEDIAESLRRWYTAWRCSAAPESATVQAK